MAVNWDNNERCPDWAELIHDCVGEQFEDDEEYDSSRRTTLSLVGYSEHLRTVSDRPGGDIGPRYAGTLSIVPS